MTRQERGIVFLIIVIILILTYFFAGYLPRAEADSGLAYFCQEHPKLCQVALADDVHYQRRKGETDRQMVDRWLLNYCRVLPAACFPWPDDLKYHQTFGGFE